LPEGYWEEETYLGRGIKSEGYRGHYFLGKKYWAYFGWKRSI